jgi:4-hydroxy-2-oxoheptanedioate aldolase
MKPTQRRVRHNLANGITSYGAAVQLASPEIVELIGYTGYDFAWIDAEHGALALSEVRELIRAADAADIDSIVRVPNHDGTYIQRVLDVGASGVMVPHISNVDQGRAVTAAAHYAPSGERGACPCGRAFGHRTQDWPSDMRRADHDVLVFGIIEDEEGVVNVEDIANDCGFDGLLFGPFDLSMTLGLQGDIAHPDVVKMQRRVLAATQAAGIQFFSSNAAWEPDLQGSRPSIVAVLGDRDSMFEMFRQRLLETRNLLGEAQPALSTPRPEDSPRGRG